MIAWCALLLSLAVIQIRFYNLTSARFARTAGGYWAMIYLGLVSSETIRHLFTETGLAWWTGVVVAFIGFLIGEAFSTLLSLEGKVVPAKARQLPSFFTMSLLFIILARVTMPHPFLVDDSHTDIVYLSLGSTLFPLLMSGISERLTLGDTPPIWRGLPILLISAALLLVGVYGIEAALPR